MTPPDFDVSNAVHAYGGGAYAVNTDGVWCVAANGLCRLREDGGADALVDESGLGDLMVGAGELFGVRESAAGDALVVVSLNDDQPEPRVLMESSGFLAAPRPGPGLMAWSSWAAGCMPWDACELWVAAYERGGRLGVPVKLAGGAKESAVEPRWGPDGSLYFMSDRSGWWNLYRWDHTSIEPVAPMEADCAAEPWELGYASYDFLSGGRVVIVAQRGPRHTLIIVDSAGMVQEVSLPYTSIKPYVAAGSETVALIGSSPTAAPQVALVDLRASRPRLEVLARAEPPALNDAAVSVPEETRIGSVVALVYPPTGERSPWPAPVIVRAHPGPTASALLRLDWQAQYFTSRGFAVVDVDYTGSTGYGRLFRQALYGRWGFDDVADCRAVADQLLGEGRAIDGQVFIRGASAGGYTALQAVMQDGPFAAATAVSAIVDPERWEATVPRFQKPHAARLKSDAGPVRSVDIRAPVLLVHGTDDDVAAADDVRELAAGLAHRHASHRLLLLDRVGHYVATSSEAATALEAELAHYLTVIDAAG